MTKWLRRIRGAVGMGFVWALGWAIVGGAVMEGIVDPHGEILDMWPQTLAIPGFLSGVVFSALLSMVAGRRRFEELSLSRFAAIGATAGLTLGALALGAGFLPAVVPVWLRAALVLAPVTLLSAASASGTLALARRAQHRDLLGASEGAADAAPRLPRAPNAVAESRTPPAVPLPAGAARSSPTSAE